MEGVEMTSAVSRATTALLVTLFIGSCSLLGPAKPEGPVTCLLDVNGTRQTRPCEEQFRTSALDIKLKGQYLQQVSAEIGISREKLVELTDKTVNTVTWLRDLCRDWNACAINANDYNGRKVKLVEIEQNFYAVVSQAQALQKTPTTKSSDDPAVRDLQGRIDVHLAEISKVAPGGNR
jgi:hypothetical protein